MKCILSILLFSLITLAAPVSQNFRLRILRTEGASGGPLSEYLGLKDGVAVITKNPSEIITAYLDPDPNGMLYTDKKIPGYLFPTDGTGTQVYDFRFGGIPKRADVLFTNFTFVDRICQVCMPDKILAYFQPKDDPSTRYEGQFRAYKDGEGWTLKFHASKPPSVEGSEGVDLIREAI
ncbi:unnamed protein product [Tuber melanosporum]|uniref:(Perigord truffle) hypothetical protein n=1 Tax=Tuber melanosporum (strain Mel28) TaxID=656061 RepID=D5GFT6_TUBMM|nr:uncharacterized protein GSTUM_00007068001 [Tuber melanosporum]CAZ83379.1 unnamed protein product [Tuber melanosporum]